MFGWDLALMEKLLCLLGTWGRTYGILPIRPTHSHFTRRGYMGRMGCVFLLINVTCTVIPERTNYPPLAIPNWIQEYLQDYLLHVKKKNVRTEKQRAFSCSNLIDLIQLGKQQ